MNKPAYERIEDILAGELALARHRVVRRRPVIEKMTEVISNEWSYDPQNPEGMANAILDAILPLLASDEDQARTVINIAFSLADVFAQDNRLFDRALFYERVGVKRPIFGTE